MVNTYLAKESLKVARQSAAQVTSLSSTGLKTATSNAQLHSYLSSGIITQEDVNNKFSTSVLEEDTQTNSEMLIANQSSA